MKLFLFILPIAMGAQPLSTLVDEALLHNREILAAQKKYEAARQRPSQESSLPDPMVSVGYTSNGAPYPGAGLGTRRHQQRRHHGLPGTALPGQAPTARRDRGQGSLGGVRAISRRPPQCQSPA